MITPNESPKEAAVEKRQARHFNWLAYVFIPIACVIITAAVTYYVQQYGNRPRYFKYFKQSSSGIIKKPELSGKNIKVMLDDRPISNISTVSIGIFNVSDKDFKDVLLEMKFTGEGKGKPIMIQPKISLPPEDCEEVKLVDQGDGSLRYGYKLHFANRSNKTIFDADYVFEGESAPNVEVRAQAEGLGLEEVSLSQITNNTTPSINDSVKILSILLMFIVMIAAIGGMVEARDKLKKLLEDKKKK